MGNSDPNGYVCTSSLLDFCRERRGPSHAFHIPLLSVYEVGKLIIGLKSKKLWALMIYLHAYLNLLFLIQSNLLLT